MSSISRKFEIELKKMSQQLANGEKIVYNNVDDLGPLDDTHTEHLYDTINGLAPETIFEYNCGFGINVHNLMNFLGCDISGSTYDEKWIEASRKHLGDVSNNLVCGLDNFPTASVSVTLIDNDNFRVSHNDLMKAIDSCKTFSDRIVVRDSQVTELNEFENAECFWHGTENDTDETTKLTHIFIWKDSCDYVDDADDDWHTSTNAPPNYGKVLDSGD